jgi:DnaJ-class molecular chaperone
VYGSIVWKDILTVPRSMAMNHPDKFAPKDTAQAAQTFIRYQRANDALTDPVKRFAYDRFGPSMLEWKDCFTIRDHVQTGLFGLVRGYGTGIIVMLVMQFFGTFPHGAYVSALESFMRSYAHQHCSGTTSP